jgi:hypothetical protein
MKNLKFIFLALGCIAALSLTSCLESNDDDNTGLSKAQRDQCFAVVRGSYTGKLLYQNRDSQHPIDTIDVSWSIGADTMLVLRPFPAKAVAEQINDTELRKALLEQGYTTELKCYLGFYRNDSEVEFLLAPVKIDIPVAYQDKTHTLSVYFWTDYSYGYKNVSTGAMEVQLMMAGAYLDDNQNYNYLSNTSSSMTGIKMIFSTLIK